MSSDHLSAVLISKLTSLQSTIEYWRSIADNKHSQPSLFQHNHSQIVRLCDLFHSLADELNQEFSAFDGSSGTAFDDARVLNKKLVQGHALWSYFQDKLMVRHSDVLRPYLDAADDFAWSCFEPILRKRQEVLASQPPSEVSVSIKIPPLIYLGPEISPYVYPRDWALHKRPASVSDGLFQEVLRASPFSFISMPYYQTAHLPEAMVLAHEMGHVVELDLGLTNDLDASFERIDDSTIPPERKRGWKRCRLEMFADVFGAVVGGAAFCLSLAQFLADDRDTILNEPFREHNTHEYPTCYLRVLLSLQVLRDTNGKLPLAAQRVEQAWIDQYGREHAQKEYEKDIPVLVTEFLDSPLPALEGGEKQTIRSLVEMSRDVEKLAAIDAENMIQMGSKPESTNPCALFAAATFAFDHSPSDYRRQGIESKVLTRIKELASDDKRNEKRSLEVNLPGGIEDVNHEKELGQQIARLLG